MIRGDVVVLEFPYADGKRGKNRPALIIQNDRDNRRLANTVVAMISGNTHHATEPTQVFIDPSVSAGASSGLHGPFVIKCCNVYTVRQQDIQRVIGKLEAVLLAAADRALEDAFGLT